ncbi:MAG TPA: hypothetical protein VMY76_00710 [Gemmatimonadales bacterium]|nr:hypothetical protein [Gemmatimonadales bacterium]
MSKADELFDAATETGAPPSSADAIFDAAPPPRAEDAGQVERGLLRAAGEGASRGFLSEISGAVSAALPDVIRNDVDRAAVGTGETFGERYRHARDYYQGQLGEAREAMPKATFAAELAGGMLGPAPKGMAGAAAQGALAGLGSSEADLTKGEVLPAARDAALGGALGAAGQKAGKAVGGYVGGRLQGVSKWFGEAAENRALDAAGLMKKARDLLLRKYGGTAQAGRLLLDEGLVGPLSSQSRIAGNIIEAAEGAGRDVGEAAKKIGDIPAKNKTREQLARELAARLVAPNAKHAGTLPLARAGKAIVEDVRAAGQGAGQVLDFPAIRAEKAAMAGPARFDMAVPAPQREAAQGAYKALRELEDEYAQAYAGMVKDPGLAEGLRSARNRAGMLEELGDAAMKRVAGYGANRVFSLTDNMAGLAGLLKSGQGSAEIPSTITGAVWALANKAFREYGPSMMAVGADKASALLQRAAQSDPGAKALQVVLRTPEGQAWLRRKVGLDAAAPP